MGKQILETNNYGKFEMTDFNRDVKTTKLLELSMKRHGWIDACPLHVLRDGNGKLKIKQGHHRFLAAQRIGIPVKYVECNDDATIYELEQPTRRWTMEDYLTSHCRVGLPEYLKVREYCEESGISLHHAISMLGGEAAGSGNFQEVFKEGKYKIRKESIHALLVKDIVLLLKKQSVKFYNTSLLVQAISKILWIKDFNLSRMKSKIKTFSGQLEKKANLDQYLDMLETLYNRQSQAKVPLKFLAYEEAKKRRLANTFTPNIKSRG